MEDCKCYREMTIYEEINALPIEERIKERLLNKLKLEESIKGKLENEIYKCHNEIDRLEKSIIYLAKIVGEYKET